MADTPMVDITDAPSSTSQVLIKLTTRDPSFTVPTQPILVPTNLKRYGLSSIVNHLLSTPKPIPFDFLISSNFLRSSLDNYLTQNGLSSETTLELEYVRSVLPPVYLASWEQDDWVSSVHIRAAEGETLKGGERILTGSYDGIARVYDLSGQIVAQAAGHTSSIKTVAWVDPAFSSASEDVSFVTAGLDRTVKLWSLPSTTTTTSDSTPAIAKPIADLVSHTSTVNILSLSSTRLLSGSSDGSIAFWSLTPSEMHDAPTSLPTASSRNPKKRRRNPEAAEYRKKPVSTMTDHTAPVSAVIHDFNNDTVAYSASWDHTIITHDLVTAATVDTRTTQHPLLSLLHLPGLSLLAAGSAARHITLHDPRASAASISSAVLRGHTNGVVSLVRSPESEFMLASGSHDGTVRVWDVRAAGAEGGCMYTVKRESGAGKVFGVDWRRNVGIVSVGEDKKVQVNGGEGFGRATILGV